MALPFEKNKIKVASLYHKAITFQSTWLVVSWAASNVRSPLFFSIGDPILLMVGGHKSINIYDGIRGAVVLV